MKGHRSGLARLGRGLGTVACASVLTACLGSQQGGDPSPSPPPAAPSSAAGEQPWTVPTHPIAVDGDRFVDLRDGREFPVRGVHYFEVVPVGDQFQDRLLASDVFDAEAVRRDFTRLSEYGYTVVRVFIDGCRGGPECITSAGMDGLDGAYLDRLAEVMRIAKDTGLFLLLTGGDLPAGGRYAAIADAANSSVFPGYRNTHFLTTAGADAFVAYWDDLLTGLREREADFDAVLGWSIQNETWVFSDQPPLSLESRVVIGADGGSYDMAVADDRRRLVAAGVANYAESVAEVIRRHDPTGLVTMGFFPPDFPNPTVIGAGRFVDTVPLLATSTLDFFDFHAYPGWDIDIQEIAENFGMVGYDAKPIVMGEFGAFVNRFDSVGAAAVALQRWVAESCAVGFDGWLYWGYKRADMRQEEVTWGLVDADDHLLEALAPREWPDPCVPQLADPNLAFERPVLVSSALPDQPGSAAVDGDPTSRWGAGRYAPQWIEVELDEPSNVGGVRLRVEQSPAGHTVHEVSVAAGDGPLRSVHTFDGVTASGDVLEVTFDPPIADVDRVRITTRISPSWVAWLEVQVLAG